MYTHTHNKKVKRARKNKVQKTQKRKIQKQDIKENEPKKTKESKVKAQTIVITAIYTPCNFRSALKGRGKK